MSHLFRSAVETLGGPGERDPVAYLMRMGTPAEGEEELRTIDGGHEIHMSSPDWYIEQFFGFADQLNI